MAPRHLDGPGSPSQPMWPWWRTNQSNPPCNSRSQWQTHFISFPMLRRYWESWDWANIFWAYSSDSICYWDRIKMQVDSSLSGWICSRLNCPDRLEEKPHQHAAKLYGNLSATLHKKKKPDEKLSQAPGWKNIRFCRFLFHISTLHLSSQLKRMTWSHRRI